MSAERQLLYVDSSALVKLAIKEPESQALKRYVGGDPLLATSAIAVVEVSRAAALANPSGEVRAVVDRLLGSCIRVAVSMELLRRARQLTSMTIRTLDAIHLASALRVEAAELVAYDRRLLAAAREQGLETSAPGAGHLLAQNAGDSV